MNGHAHRAQGTLQGAGGVDVGEIRFYIFKNEATLGLRRGAPKTSAGIGSLQQGDVQADSSGGGDVGARQCQWVVVGAPTEVVVQVVELAHCDDASAHHVQIRPGGEGANVIDGEGVGVAVHGLTPSPEVIRRMGGRPGFYPSTQGTLKSMAVSVDEAGQHEVTHHADVARAHDSCGVNDDVGQTHECRSSSLFR